MGFNKMMSLTKVVWVGIIVDLTLVSHARLARVNLDLKVNINSPKAIQAPVDVPSDIVPSDKPQICDLEPETGPCRGHSTMFYYDNKSKDCKTFIYGGCGGNGNRFGSKVECLKTCQGAPEQIEDIEKAAGSRKASGSTTHPEFVCSVPPPFC